MPTEAEIKAKYKELHDSLSEDYYENHLMSKEEFDIQHGKIWNDMELELIAKGYLTLPEPPRDLAKEMDKLKVRLKKLEVKPLKT